MRIRHAAAVAVVTATAVTSTAAAFPAAGRTTASTSAQHRVVQAVKAERRPSRAAVVRRIALAAGLQVGRKHTHRPTVRYQGRTYPAPNPYLAEQIGSAPVDWHYWRRWLGHRSDLGVRPRTEVPTATAYREREVRGRIGDNDRQARAERITDVGLGRAYQAVDVSGVLSALPVRTFPRATREDQGSIPRATPTHLGKVRKQIVVTTRIGDGPFGRARRGTGDFDFFRVTAAAGKTIDATTAGSHFDTVLAVYDAKGRILTANDDDETSGTLTSRVSYPVTTSGVYYVMVSGLSRNGGVPANPFRSGSGAGAGSQGAYRLTIASRVLDKDYYGVYLHSGDVLGGGLTGNAGQVEVHRLNGSTALGSRFDISGIYPTTSPLPGGQETFAYVAERPGWYAVSADVGAGAYKLRLETYPPGDPDGSPPVQKIFLDFDGERVNTAQFGGVGVATLSPLWRFLGRWGIQRSGENAVIDAVVRTVKENIHDDLVAKGLNGRLRVDVLNSRDDPDSFGDPGVARVVVGGTIRQSGVPTIGISSSIDPGNYGHEDSALALLDVLSAPAGPRTTLNTYLTRRSNRVAFVGQAVGNVVSHEIGHTIGNLHTQNSDKEHGLMDSGGFGYAYLYGVGPDGIGGTSDDPDRDFNTDRLAVEEGLTGTENTLNTSAWAFLAPPP